MHRTFGNSELGGGLPNSGLMLDYVFPRMTGRSLSLGIVLNALTPKCFLVMYMGEGSVLFRGEGRRIAIKRQSTHAEYTPPTSKAFGVFLRLSM